jgi:hypothetical protein
MPQEEVMKHSLQHNVLGEVDFEGERWTFKYFYPENLLRHSPLVITGVVKMQAMRTGCYVLHRSNGEIVVVPPKFLWCLEKKEVEPHGNC